jgi:hypothetical protein
MDKHLITSDQRTEHETDCSKKQYTIKRIRAHRARQRWGRRLLSQSFLLKHVLQEVTCFFQLLLRGQNVTHIREGELSVALAQHWFSYLRDSIQQFTRYAPLHSRDRGMGYTELALRGAKKCMRCCSWELPRSIPQLRTMHAQRVIPVRRRARRESDLLQRIFHELMLL